jgi:hypothetical protein
MTNAYGKSVPVLRQRLCTGHVGMSNAIYLNLNHLRCNFIAIGAVWQASELPRLPWDLRITDAQSSEQLVSRCAAHFRCTLPHLHGCCCTIDTASFAHCHLIILSLWC